MKRKADYPLTKHSLNLRIGDFDRLQVMYPRLGAGRVIREVVIALVDKVELKLGEPEIEPATGELP